MTDVDVMAGKRLLCVVCGESCLDDTNRNNPEGPERWPFRTFTFGMGEDCARAVLMVGVCDEHRRLTMDAIEEAGFGVLMWMAAKRQIRPRIPNGWPT